MVNKESGKSLVKQIIKRYEFVDENPHLIKDRLLSEQDISTKFVLPMLSALNWDPMKITTKGPEVHEHGFRERDIEGDVWKKVRKGLPDLILKGRYSKVPFFVEVKHPSKKLNLQRDLQKYEDGHMVFLTSFRESWLVVVGSRKKKTRCRSFKATSPNLYLTRFDNLWQHMSNTKEAEGTRRAIKANRPGQR